MTGKRTAGAARRCLSTLLCATACLAWTVPSDVRAQKTSKSTSAQGAPTKPRTAKQASKTSRKAAPKAPVAADSAPPLTGDPQKDQARQAAERDRLTSRIAELNKQIAAGERSRSGAASALARAERSLAEVNRRLDELAQRQKAAQELVVALDRQRAGTEGRIAVGESGYARTMTQLYARRQEDPVRTFLGGGDPNEASLTDGYLRILARAEAAEVDALRTKVAELQDRRKRADDDNRVLARQADAEKTARETLASDQAAQRQALDRLSHRLAEQRDAASAMAADEKRLGRVVEQLQRVIEQQAAEEKARRLAAAKRQADREAAARKRKESPSSGKREAPPPPRAEPEPEREDAPGGGAFAKLRGQLRLPVRGAVTGRFGAPRGNGGATWKGLFVRTEAGADVRAVAAGKVIYADDLRGFGNLLIVDHGNQYLSIYANNDTLLKRAGDTVAVGDVVSRSGNSSGDDQTGLYFELRFRGRPFDPMPWIGSR